MPNIRPLSDALAKRAAEELNEIPERIQTDLEAFREWILKSPHLKARTDDQFLIVFLRGCKYSLEKAKKKFDIFYTTRTLLPEIIRNRDPSNDRLAAIIRCGIGLPLPLTEKPDSPTLTLIRPGAYDPNQFSLAEVFKISTMIQDIMMREDDNYCIIGEMFIIDLTNVTLSHFKQFDPYFIKKITVMSQGGPVRQKAHHFIHPPFGFETFFNIYRLYVHGSNLESLHKMIPKRLLPREYGGDSGTIQSLINNWEKKFNSYREFFLEEEHYGTDEKKRVGIPQNADSVFGVMGSFRKLTVD